MEDEEELFDFTSSGTDTSLDNIVLLSSSECHKIVKEQDQIQVDTNIQSELDINFISSFISDFDCSNSLDGDNSCELPDTLETDIFSSICDVENGSFVLSQDSSEKNVRDSLTDRINTVKFEEKEDCETKKRLKQSHSSPQNHNLDVEVSLFTTANNKKIISGGLKQPKFTRSGVGRPAHSYLRPEKGHKSTLHDEKKTYIDLFNKIHLHFNKDPIKWLKIQFRWVWIHLKLNELPLTEAETIGHLKIRKSTEYSILRRIVEGDDVSYRYMILLVIDIGNEFVEGYDGFYSVRIVLDNELQKEIKSNRLLIGSKIKLFGCKYLFEGNLSIFDLKEDQPVFLAYYNGFSYASQTRVLGYRKKISFIKSIKTIKKEGGVISCIKGVVKRVIETKYVVQVKDYRNTVDDLEKEYENIIDLMNKNNESFNKEDVKVRTYINFIVEDSSGEFLITSWMYIDKIKKGDSLILCGLIPVLRSTGIHFSTTRRTYIKFLT